MVNTQTAKTIAYLFLAIAILSFFGSVYFAVQDEEPGNVKNLLILTAVCIVGASSAGLAWKSQSKITNAQVLNFISSILASILVGVGAFQSWGNISIGIGAIIGILTGFELVVD